MNKIIKISILAIYIAFIYSTLSVAPAIFSYLRKTIGPSFNLIVNVSMIALPLILLLVISGKIKNNVIFVYAGLIAAGFIYFLLVKYLKPSLAEKVHFFEYGVAGWLALWAFDDMKPFFKKYLLIFIVIAAAGYFDEFIQRFTPGRVYDLRDVFNNVVSGILGVVIIMFVRRGIGEKRKPSH